jgi:alkylation response protein AidB-like acyl-CoA dehydrogenase
LDRRSRGGGKCKLGAEADSEIPELGLDSGRLNVDCDLNPVRMAGAAYEVAKEYGRHRQARRYQPQSTRLVKRKRTRIHIDRDYERAKINDDNNNDDEHGAGADEQDDQMAPAGAGHQQGAHPTDEQSSAIDPAGEADGDDDDDD